MNPFLILAGVAGVAMLFRKPQASVTNVVVPSPSTSTSTPKPAGTSVSTIASNAVTYPAQVAVQAMATGNLGPQAVYLYDLGAVKTSDALRHFGDGELTAAQVIAIANTETNKPSTGYVPSPKGTTAVDKYGLYLLSNVDSDTLYKYAITSNSIPFVRDAANRLAEEGDTRASQLTQHLADIS